MKTAEEFFAEIDSRADEISNSQDAEYQSEKELDSLIDELVANDGKASDTYLFKAGMSREQTILGHVSNLASSAWTWANEEEDGRSFDQVMLDDRNQREEDFLNAHPMIKSDRSLMDKGSFTAGRVGMALVDPIGFLIPVGKGGTLAKLAYNSAYGATDATIRSYSEQGEFDKSWAVMGGAFGAGAALASPLVGKVAKKWGKNSLQAKQAALDTLENTGHVGAVEQGIIKAAAEKNPRIKELRDKWMSFETNTPTIALFNKEIEGITKKLNKKEITKSTYGELKFKAIQGLGNEIQEKAAVADELYTTLLEELSKKATITDRTVDAIHKGFLMTTRPLFGGLLGGTGAALMTNDDESILYSIAVGAVLGGFQKRIQNSKHIPTSVKKNILDKSKHHAVVGIMPRLKIATAATLHTKLSAYGGPLKSFADSLFTPMYRKPGEVPKFSIEARSDHMKITFLNAFEDVASNTSVADREAAVKILRGFEGEYTDGSVKLASELKAQLTSLKQYAQEVGVELPEEIENYVPRIWDKNKMSANQPDMIKKLEQYLRMSQPRIGKKKARDDALKLFHDVLGETDPKETLISKIKSLDDADNVFAELPIIKHMELDRKIKGGEEVEKLFEPYLVNDITTIMKKHIDETVRSVEFSRTFGRKGEGLKAYRSLIHEKYNKAREKAETNGIMLGKNQLLPEEMKEISLMYDSVNAFYGTHGKLRSSATSKSIAALTLIANLKYLPTVAISNLMDLAQPLQNSGSWKGIVNGLKRTSLYSKGEKSRHAMSVGEQKAIMQEMQAEGSMNNLPSDVFSRALIKTNEWFFKFTMLPKVTSLGRRFAYNTGMETAFDMSKKLATVTNPAKKAKYLRKLNHAGVSSEMAKKLSAFNSVDDILKSEGDAKLLLEQVGFKAAERDSKIPRVGNRLLFTQTRDPLVRTLGLYTSWAQAKSAQVNSLISKIEDGDSAQLVRMLGMIPIAAAANEIRYWLINGKDSKQLEAENMWRMAAKGNVFSGNTGWLMASAANVGYMDTPLELAVTGNVASDMFSASKDIVDGEWDRAFKDFFGDAMINKMGEGRGWWGDKGMSLTQHKWNKDEGSYLGDSRKVKTAYDVYESNKRAMEEVPQ